jgi:hypothetical protein
MKRDSQAVEKASSGTTNRPTFTIREQMMKKLFALPLAVLFVAACSDSTTAPATTSANLTPSYGKHTNPPPPPPPPTPIVNDTYTFSGASISSAGSHFGTDAPAGATFDATDDPGSNIQTAPNGEQFLGRFNHTQTRALLVLDDGYTNYNLTFNLYTIGSWDGKGKQAQNGFFLANVFSVVAVCSATESHELFASTFSNQLTVQQDFPANIAIGQSGGNKAATGSVTQDALNYKSRPDLSNTPPFRSFGDVTYALTFAGANPCGAGHPVTFAFSSTAPGQQDNWDESWGIDNVHIQAGN